MTKEKKIESGFSLVEMIIVLSILMILSLTVIINLDNFKKSQAALLQTAEALAADYHNQLISAASGRLIGPVGSGVRYCGFGITKDNTDNISYRIYAGNKTYDAGGQPAVFCKDVEDKDYTPDGRPPQGDPNPDVIIESRDLLNSDKIEFRSNFSDVFYESPEPLIYIANNPWPVANVEEVVVQLKGTATCTTASCVAVCILAEGPTYIVPGGNCSEVPTPSPEPTPTVAPTATPTFTPTPTPGPTPTPTATPGPTPTPTVTPTSSVTPTPTATPSLPSPISYWNFDSIGSPPQYIVTDSIDGNDGSGNTIVVQPGQVGNSYYMGGAPSSVTVPDNANLRPNANGYSVAFWVKPSGSGTRTVYSKGAQNQTNEWLLFLDSGNKFNLYLAQSVNTLQAQTGSGLSNGLWYHIVAVSDPASVGEETKIYINGAKDSVQILSVGGYPNINNTQSLRLGHRNTNGFPSGSSYFVGNLDDVRMYTQALSAQQVQDLYNSF